MLFGSGMAAATAVFQALKPGDHVIAPQVMYWALRSWLAGWLQPWGIAVDLVDMTDANKVRAAVRPGKTKLIWVETPANPTWCVTDLAAIAEIAGSSARGWPWTTLRRRCSPAGRWAPTSSCIPAPSISTAIATCWAAR
jgi:cystathionine gamma-synthase